MLKKIAAFIFFIIFMQALPAQKVVIPEYIRCQSIKGPVMDYWQNEGVKKYFSSQLNSILLKYHHAALIDSTNLQIQILDADNTSDLSALYKSNDVSDNIHMYLSIFESTPQAFSSKFIEQRTTLTDVDSILLKNMRSVFMLNVTLTKKDSIIFESSLDMIINSGNTPGIGIQANTVAITPKGFAEVLKVGMNILFNPENNMSEIEVKAAPGFVGDNFILAKTMGQPHVYVTTIKNVHAFNFKGSEMIRMGEGIYEEIHLKGKKAIKLSSPLDEIIKKTKNFSTSDFVFLHQDCRDVVRNKNYSLKLLVQIDGQNPPPNPSLLFTGFLKDNIHILLNESDTTAIFSIEKSKTDPNKKLYVDKITNGYDSSSLFLLRKSHEPWNLVYDYVVIGKIGIENFSIQCAGFGNTLKEIFVNDKLICIAQGKFVPEKFVFLDTTISPEIFNQLLMIGFNRFFE